jgi:hypothetical protein
MTYKSYRSPVGGRWRWYIYIYDNARSKFWGDDGRAAFKNWEGHRQVGREQAW